MNRRGFLQLLGAAAAAPIVAAPALDLGRRIFLPPRGGWPARDLFMFTRTVGLDEFRRKYLQPAMRELVRRIEVDALEAAGRCAQPMSGLSFGAIQAAARDCLVEVSNDGGASFEVRSPRVVLSSIPQATVGTITGQRSGAVFFPGAD